MARYVGAAVAVAVVAVINNAVTNRPHRSGRAGLARRSRPALVAARSTMAIWSAAGVALVGCSRRHRLRAHAAAVDRAAAAASTAHTIPIEPTSPRPRYDERERSPMPADELREAVKGLMARAKDDLAELVSFQSVADPKQYPPEECEKAAAVGRRRVRRGRAAGRHELADAGRLALRARPRARARRHADRAALLPLRRPAAARRGRVDVPVFELTERDGRWYGRGSADCKGNIVMHLTALRALKQVDGGFPCGVKLICEGSEEQGTGGLEAFVPENVELLKADTILVVDTGNFAVGVPTLTTTLRGMTSIDVWLEALAQPDALGHVRRARAGPGRGADPAARVAARRARQHDDRRPRQRRRPGPASSTARSSSARTPTCSTAPS